MRKTRKCMADNAIAIDKGVAIFFLVLVNSKRNKHAQKQKEVYFAVTYPNTVHM